MIPASSRSMPDLGPYALAVERFPTIRQSLLSAFDECALSSKFEYEGRIGSTHPQARGSIFHRVAAKCFREMARMQEGRIPVDAALAILHETLRQHDVDRACPECRSSSIDPVLRAGGLCVCLECGCRFPTDLMNLPMREVKDLYMVVKKFAHDNEWDVMNLVAVEQRLSTTVRYEYEGGWVERRVTGALDALFATERDTHARVIDFKDTWALPAPTEISFKGYFQQRMYALLVFDYYPSIDRVTLVEFYPRYSEPRTATLHREELEDVRSEITALVERFDRLWAGVIEGQLRGVDGYMPPTAGKRCSYCARPQSCPIPVGLRNEGRIRDGEEAARVARQLVVGKSVVKQSQAALQAWTDAHGPVPIKDAKGVRQLGYVASKQTRRPDRETMERALAMQAAGEPVDLDALYKETLTTRFMEHVPKRGQEDEEAEVLLAALEGALADAQSRAG